MQDALVIFIFKKLILKQFGDRIFRVEATKFRIINKHTLYDHLILKPKCAPWDAMPDSRPYLHELLPYHQLLCLFCYYTNRTNG